MKKIFIITFISALMLGCAKWVNIDISNDTISLISPLDNSKDSLQSKTFAWEEMKGVDNYRIQIVSPTFDSIVSFVLDSPSTDLMYAISLTPGEYGWRVRGENEDFKSKWATRSFEVTSTASLNGQSITNIQPITGTNSNLLTHTFTWNELISAQQYFIQILDENENQLTVNNVTNTNYTFTFSNEGTFSVSIQGINNISASLSNEVKLLIDTTMPSLPTLTYPAFDTIRSFPKNFEWQVASNPGSIINERLQIATDSLMNNLLLDTVFTKNSPIALDSIPAKGRLYWKLNRTDAAGNVNNNVKSQRFYID